MIELIPAIDIINGKCVRLTKGDFSTKKVYGDPLEMAQRFESLGFKRLHVVDLDGARSKHVVNLHVLKSITSSTKLEVDFGGGIKTTEDLEKAFDAGASMVTVGSVAVTEAQKVLEWLEKYGPARLILGADVKDGLISINGWQENSSIRLAEFLPSYMAKGIRNILCTEISKDGMLSGPAIELYSSIMRQFPQCHLIASGGVGSIQDIEKLEKSGIPAVVFGKAIYEGKIDMEVLSNRYNLRGGSHAG